MAKMTELDALQLTAAALESELTRVADQHRALRSQLRTLTQAWRASASRTPSKGYSSALEAAARQLTAVLDA